MITVGEIVSKVRDLALRRPDHVYIKDEDGAQCSYTGPAVGVPGEGCIVGQALMELGIKESALDSIEQDHGALGVSELVRGYSDRLGIEKPENMNWAAFLGVIQGNQDISSPWGEAWREAVRIEVLRRHDFVEREPGSETCGECLLDRDNSRHQGRVQVGDIVMNILDEDLDPRTVVKVEKNRVWLDVMGAPMGPMDEANYTTIDFDPRVLFVKEGENVGA